MDPTKEPHQSAHSPDRACTTLVAVKIEAEIEAAYASINNTLHEEHPALEASGSCCPAKKTRSSPSPQVRRSSRILGQGGYSSLTLPAGFLFVKPAPNKRGKGDGKKNSGN
ncbi:hypothetical protein PCANC_23795 [Puccinia coronata f. sp. avenae]|nr:hypothetical protein PCANC_23795 [Puccinia coronata f. sp. avenae]